MRAKKMFIRVSLILFVIFLMPLIVVGIKLNKIYEVQEVEPARVAIVFGAGLVNNTTPSDMLSDRLSIAAELYQKEKVAHILVSGDNRTEDYSEPDVMRDTLVNTYGVPENDIFLDYAGRRTYDTCIRAHTLWGVDTAILVSQEYHLPRAIWTCEQFGIESRGVSASLQPYVHEIEYTFRELAAVYKAFVDVYLWRPEYIGGDAEGDID